MTQTTTQTAQSGQPIKFRIVITEEGKLGFFTESGTFDQGNAQIEKLLAMLGSADFSFEEIGVPEQHRHDEDPEHVLSDAHAMSHAH